MGLFKKVKKVFKKAASVATLGASDAVSNLVNPKIDNTAANLQAEANRQAAEQQQLLQNMQSNFAADLKGENLSNVVAGGTADLSGMGSEDARRRRRTGGLTASLGV